MFPLACSKHTVYRKMKGQVILVIHLTSPLNNQCKKLNWRSIDLFHLTYKCLEKKRKLIQKLIEPIKKRTTETQFDSQNNIEGESYFCFFFTALKPNK